MEWAEVKQRLASGENQRTEFKRKLELRQASNLRGLRTFQKDYPEAEAALLHRGAERLRINGIWCLPIADFLRELRPNRELLQR